MKNPGSIGRLWVCSVVACLLLAAPSAAVAAEPAGIVITLPADLSAEQRDVLIEALEKLGQPVSLGEPAGPGTEDPAVSDLTLAIGRFDAAMAAAGQVPSLLAVWWRELSGAGGVASLLALLAGLAALAAGLGLEYLVDRLLDRWRQVCLTTRTERFAPKLGLAFGWFGLEILGLVVFGAGAVLVGWLILPDTATARLSLAVAVIGVIKARLLLALGHLVFAPRMPNLRMIDMPDADARLICRWILLAAVVAAAALGIRDVLGRAGASPEAAALLGIAATVAILASRLTAVFRTAEPIGGLIRRSYRREDGTLPALAGWSADGWHLAFAAFAVLAFLGELHGALTASVGVLTSAAIGPFVILALLPFALGAWSGLLDDLMIARAEDTRQAVIGDVVKTLGQGALILITFVVLATTWGANPFAGADAGVGSRITRAVFEAGAAILVAWAIWQGVKVVLQRYEPQNEVIELGSMGQQGSRIATLLPVIRSFLFVTILMIAAMTALAALGVNIGPLLAGAGVLGLAIGFGAQTLVKDVITGLFFLLEDAFRKGEYIETSAGKGVVERISMRSVQLRHHRGPLYTVAFGQMGNIVNHSRDWVKIKFELRVPFETDLDLVRKVIKQVGEEIQAEPELGPMLLQPLKSQGVTQVDDSGFMIGVKFMSRPGQQFLVRREAYARIKKAFVENGIEFASRRVMVAGGEHDHDAERSAAASLAATG